MSGLSLGCAGADIDETQPLIEVRLAYTDPAPGLQPLGIRRRAFLPRNQPRVLRRGPHVGRAPRGHRVPLCTEHSLSSLPVSRGGSDSVNQDGAGEGGCRERVHGVRGRNAAAGCTSAWDDPLVAAHGGEAAGSERPGQHRIMKVARHRQGRPAPTALPWLDDRRLAASSRGASGPGKLQRVRREGVEGRHRGRQRVDHWKPGGWSCCRNYSRRMPG